MSSVSHLTHPVTRGRGDYVEKRRKKRLQLGQPEPATLQVSLWAAAAEPDITGQYGCRLAEVFSWSHPGVVIGSDNACAV